MTTTNNAIMKLRILLGEVAAESQQSGEQLYEFVQTLVAMRTFIDQTIDKCRADLQASAINILPPGHLFDRSKFPIVIRGFSGKDGSELFRRDIEAPTGLVAVEIPGFGHMPEHLPVSIRLDFADGTSWPPPASKA